MDFWAFIEALLVFFRQMMENKDKPSLEASVRRRRGHELLAINHVLRNQMGLRGQELRDARGQVWAEYQASPDDYLLSLVDEAHEAYLQAMAGDTPA